MKLKLDGQLASGSKLEPDVEVSRQVSRQLPPSWTSLLGHLWATEICLYQIWCVVFGIWSASLSYISLGSKMQKFCGSFRFVSSNCSDL